MAEFIFNVKYDGVTKEMRTISKGVVLGAQFGLGANGLIRALSSWGITVEPETAKIYIDRYRAKYKKIVAFWYALEEACIKAIASGQLVQCGMFNIKVQANFLFIKLPIGRTISYFKPKTKLNVTPWGAEKLGIVYKSAFGDKPLRGGLLFENITQGVARDFMCESMLLLDSLDFKVTMSVHDEIVVEGGPSRFNEFMETMQAQPKWALDFPLAAEGFHAKRYRK